MLLFPQPCLKVSREHLLTKIDYSFLRLPNRYIDTMVDDGSDSICETIHFSDMSNNFEHISGLTNHQCENVFELLPLLHKSHTMMEMILLLGSLTVEAHIT